MKALNKLPNVAITVIEYANHDVIPESCVSISYYSLPSRGADTINIDYLLKDNCMKYVKKISVADVVRMLFIFLFTYTASAKLAGYDRFRGVLKVTPFINQYADLIAWMVPVAEIIIVLMLCIQRLSFYGLLSAVVLLTIFTFYIALMIRFSTRLPCSCGGVIQQLTWKQHLLFNFFFIATGSSVLWWERCRFMTWRRYIKQNISKIFIAIKRK